MSLPQNTGDQSCKNKVPTLLTLLNCSTTSWRVKALQLQNSWRNIQGVSDCTFDCTLKKYEGNYSRY